MCRQCGQAWHAACVLKTKSCPNCRSVEGYVKPRPYEQLINIISTGKVRCNYCQLLIKKKKTVQAHLSVCKKYEMHLLRHIGQERRVLCKSMELGIPQDPVELNPLLNLNVKTTLDILDLRSQPRKIFIDLEISRTPMPTHFALTLRPHKSNPFPLNLSLLLSDSLNTIPQFPCIPDAQSELAIEIIVAEGSTFRLWLTAL
jgi:hypothetical protein